MCVVTAHIPDNMGREGVSNVVSVDRHPQSETSGEKESIRFFEYVDWIDMKNGLLPKDVKNLP